MVSTHEEDIELQRASGSYLLELRTLLGRCLWKKSQSNSHTISVHHSIKERDLNRVLALISPFQEDPQLLDSHLKYLIPPLVEAYLLYLQYSPRHKQVSQQVQLSSAIGLIIDVFCKVRGQKVIVGFLNNEPRYLETILSQLEILSHDDDRASDITTASAWQERYVLLLWLSHLMLAPFDLATISSTAITQEKTSLDHPKLPQTLSSVPLRVLPLCIKYMSSATKERNAASRLLVRLILRPDMRKIGLLRSMIQWSLDFFTHSSSEVSAIHGYLGVLTFFSQLLSSGTAEEIGTFIPALYQTSQNVLDSPHLSAVRASAVARKLLIKCFRTIVVHGVQNEAMLPGIDLSAILEEVIDHLLQALADGDTPVRLAASKALSTITLKLDPVLAEEVVEAVIGSLAEDVLWHDSERDLSAVNPLRWHGLTLTLAHLLYRKAPPTSQLADILNALLLALNFEQRSSTGSSIGTNVRDAACFGIWAMSRRYAASDLSGVRTVDIKAADIRKHGNISVVQFLAIELLVAACLDPAGNIRRGSSAALQELVGRHPDTIIQGIPLVQIVDFHAVGLRDRALRTVAIQAARLDVLYWQGLYDNFLGWRGVGSVDASSRISSSVGIASLSSFMDIETVASMFQQVKWQLLVLPKRDVEGRHGTMMTLSAIIDRGMDDLRRLSPWDILSSLKLQEKDFSSTISRPELTAFAVCSLISSMAKFSHVIYGQQPNLDLDARTLQRHLNWCLRRDEKDILGMAPSAVENVLLATISDLARVTTEWLTVLKQGASYSGAKGAGYTLALGSAYHVLSTDNLSTTSDLPQQIIQVLTERCTPKVDIEARCTALKSLQLTFADVASSTSKDREDQISKIAQALHTALNDYTINERGDVGSLVRLEALCATESAWRCTFLDSPASSPLYDSVVRLSLEKLDRIRMRAAQALALVDGGSSYISQIVTTEGVSSYAYFKAFLALLQSNVSKRFKSAILEGYVSAMGMASESVVQASRMALIATLTDFPASSTSSPDTFALLEFGDSLVDVYQQHVSNDRVLLPLMESLTFLFDMRVMCRLASTEFKWRTLLSLVQKSHFKSTQMHKLCLALELYRGLAEVESIRALVLIKIKSMLVHPFPKIRVAAAEALYCITQNGELEKYDWSQSPVRLKTIVEKINAV
ncbi:hypothetical protein EJ05DRAFT_495072 [Pseudovirgaria hyperparasitica]|uniref:Uncharacterized protein n=1 Tax=Pseudovirgaria hyperparasitica TaxID=470096 RepID=A0A6A6VSY3_9PEZI|nr:uncharacterized protein EJ05DRAFT_495072 [Pseudovirgaria hyperparasitica]KAF2752989.1 hypothetical protein EJ05DRAFT_495072 [Pseudovirgaria hyperparasitica]